jgi:hypothetical protein
VRARSGPRGQRDASVSTAPWALVGRRVRSSGGKDGLSPPRRTDQRRLAARPDVRAGLRTGENGEQGRLAPCVPRRPSTAPRRRRVLRGRGRCGPEEWRCPCRADQRGAVRAPGQPRCRRRRAVGPVPTGPTATPGGASAFASLTGADCVAPDGPFAVGARARSTSGGNAAPGATQERRVGPA